MKNNITWKGYETITAYIFKNLRQKEDITIKGVGHTCTFEGISGVVHQIDVLTSEYVDDKIFKTAIECKYWNKKINKDTVMKLWAIVTDCNFQRGIIVSRKGFTRDAKRFADYYNIKLVEFREREQSDHPIESDLEIGILYNKISVNLKRPVITNIRVETENAEQIVLLETDYFQIKNVFGQTISSKEIILMFKKDLHKEIPNQETTKKYVFIDYDLNHKGFKHKINSICFTGLLNEINKDHNTTISIVDKVWLIMKNLFESTTFVISENGAISEYQEKRK